MGNTKSNPSPIVRPPMKIHQKHGKNLTISSNRLSAKRHEGYSDGLFFGSRPAVHGEKFELIVFKIVTEWNGALRFGFTTHTPDTISSHPEGIPRYMCPDLIKRGGSFVETLSQISLREKDKIVFWLESSGEVFVRVNDVMQKCQIRGINKDAWPVVDVYGNTVEVSFRSLDDNPDLLTVPTAPRYYSSLNLSPFPIVANAESVFIDSYIDSSIAIRIGDKKVYSWNENPLYINTVWTLFVCDVDHNFKNNLSVAILKNAPQLKTLPDRISDIRRETGWFIEDIYKRMVSGDELAICITETGSVMVAYNGESFEEMAKVSLCGSYWIIADLGCRLISLKSVGIFNMTPYSLPILPAIENFAELDISKLNLVEGDSKVPLPSNVAKEDFKSLPAPPKNEPVVQEHIETSECVICLDLKPDTVFIPCGHVCCCNVCANNLKDESYNPICPACRKGIEKVIPVRFCGKC